MAVACLRGYASEHNAMLHVTLGLCAVGCDMNMCSVEMPVSCHYVGS